MFLKKTKKTNRVRLFRALKHLVKFHKFTEFYHRSAAPFKRLQLWFFKKNIDVLSYDLFHPHAARVFAMLSLQYRKGYFSFALKQRYKRVRRIKKY